MAEVKREVLGCVRGRVGNRVYREMNGKTFVSERPRKYKPTKSKALKSVRHKFGLTVDFAKFINSIPVLKEVWTRASVPGTNSYQKLIKHNTKLSGENSLTVNNIITPPGIQFMLKDINFSKRKISFSIDLADNKGKWFFSYPFQVYFLIYLYEPVNKKAEQFKFISSNSKVDSATTGGLYSVQLDLKANERSLFNKYKKQIVYLALVSEHTSGRKVYWSSTCTAQVKY
jgi:hypothetical protein